MKYRNKETGSIIDVDSKLGGKWELVENDQKVSTTQTKRQPPKKKASEKS